MERNYRNYIKWKDPAEERNIETAPEEEVYNTEEIQAIFDTKISSELIIEKNARVFENVPVQISCEDAGEEIKVYLEVNSSPPYNLRTRGREVGSGLEPEDFPFQFEVNPEQGEDINELTSFEESFDVEIESKIGNTDTRTVSVLFDFDILVTSSSPDSTKGKAGDYWIVKPDQEEQVTEVSATSNFVDDEAPSETDGIDGSFWLNLITSSEEGTIDIGKIEEIAFTRNFPKDSEGEDGDISSSSLYKS